MKVNTISFTNSTAAQAQLLQVQQAQLQEQLKAQTQPQPSKNTGYLEKFYTGAKNSADLTDAILVPRTIFKGYLGIMSGTALLTVGALLNKHPKISKPFSILGTLISLYGTYAFVRPYVIKNSKGVQTVSDIQTQK